MATILQQFQQYEKCDFDLHLYDSINYFTVGVDLTEEHLLISTIPN